MCVCVCVCYKNPVPKFPLPKLGWLTAFGLWLSPPGDPAVPSPAVSPIGATSPGLSPLSSAGDGSLLPSASPSLARNKCRQETRQLPVLPALSPGALS